MKPSSIAVEELLPHAGNMVLIDRLDSVTDSGAQASVSADNRGLFSRAPAVPAWVGIEYMAQTIAAWAGFNARQQGEAPRLGLLIGSRNYQSHVECFADGQPLQVQVERVFQDANGMASFDASIHDADGALLVSANLNVFQPGDEQMKQMMENNT